MTAEDPLSDSSPLEQPPRLVSEVEASTSVLAAGASFNGTLELQDSVRVEGEFTGEIKTTGELQIATGARIKGTVRSDRIEIAGIFEGELHCEGRLHLMPSARVRGNVTTRELTVDPGASMDGKVAMSRSRGAKQVSE